MFKVIENKIFFGDKLVAQLQWGLDNETKERLTEALKDSDKARGELYDQGWNECIDEHNRIAKRVVDELEAIRKR